MERSKIARISQRIEQVAEVLGRKPRAWLFADYGETNEQVVARYLARHPEDTGHDFMICRWRSPGEPERPMVPASPGDGRPME